MFWKSLAFLFASLFWLKKNLTSKTSQREYFFCTSLPLDCPSSFSLFSVCAIFLLFVFLSSLLFQRFLVFFSAYFYCRSLSVFSLFVVPFANRVLLRCSPYFSSFFLVLMFFTSLFFDAMTWCSRGWLRKVNVKAYKNEARKERTKPKDVCHRMRNVIRSLREDVQVFASGWRTRVNGRTVTKRSNGRSWYRWCAFSAARDDVVQDALWVEFVGQVLRDVIGNCANRRNPGGGMSHDGSFDWLDAGRELCVGWRKHHACVPSHTDLNRAVWGIHRRQHSCWNRSGSLQWCTARRRWQRTVCKSFVDSTHVVLCCCIAMPIEITCNQVNRLTILGGSDGEDELLGNAQKSSGRWVVVDEMRHVKAPLAWPTPGLLPSLDQADRAWCHEGKWTWHQYWGGRRPCCRESRILRDGSRGTDL